MLIFLSQKSNEIFDFNRVKVYAYGSDSEKYIVKTVPFHQYLSLNTTDASVALSGPVSGPLFLAEQEKE